MTLARYVLTVWGCALTVVSLSGCVSSRSGSLADVGLDVPETWSNTGNGVAGVPEPWLADLGCPELPVLVAEGLSGNFSLKMASARLRSSQAQLWVTRAGLFPSVDAEVAGSRTRWNTETDGGVVPSRVVSTRANLAVSWEADLWGRVRYGVWAAKADAQAAGADVAAARLSLAGQIAKAWFGAISATRQLELAGKTLESYRNSQTVIEEQYGAGATSALDVRLIRADVAGVRRRVAADTLLRDRAVKALEVLLGRHPAGTLAVPSELPALSASVPAGLPAELLERRPDLLAAVRRYDATTALATQAHRNRLPSLRLTASGGTASDELKNLLDWDYLVWTLAENLAAPVFDAGALKARAQGAEANVDAALAEYAQAVQMAFLDMELALTAETLLREEESALDVVVTESVEAERIALEQYQGGLVDVITLLSTQRRVFEARENLIDIKNRRLQSRVDLHLALGGAFETEPDDVGGEAGGR